MKGLLPQMVFQFQNSLSWCVCLCVSCPAQGAKGSSRQRAQGASLSDLQQLLEAPAKGAGLAAAGSKGRGGKQGGDSRVRQLLGLVTARGEGAPDFWALLSLLDAADALLLCHAEAGEGGGWEKGPGG